MIKLINEGNGKLLFDGEIESINDFFRISMDRYIPQLKTEYIFTGTYKKLNLGGGNKDIIGFDNLQLPDWDAEHDRIPFENESVSVIYAFHFFEHIKNIKFLLQECQRVLIHDGIFNIMVPYFRSGLAYQDIDHVNFFTEDTWRVLFDNKYYNTDKYNKDGTTFEWKFNINVNFIMGLNQKDISLFTQLIKV
jgi:SAM-dependent methyltransferase